MDMNEVVDALRENTEEMKKLSRINEEMGRLNQLMEKLIPLLGPAIRATDVIQEQRASTNKLRAGIKKQLDKLYADPS